MNNIEKAAQLIKKGELVAFPTETVYGLGANALDQSAALKIYALKGRPSNNPLIVHVASLEQAEILAEFNDNALTLSSFWPGPLTLVLPKKSNSKLADCVTAGLNTVAIRIPAHKIALELITMSNCPIAAPSANKSGSLSPTAQKHVEQNFTNKVFILESQDICKYGLESTIVDLSAIVPTILRLGFITPENIESVLKKKVIVASKLSKIKAPGMLLKHYSPETKLRLNATNLKQEEVGLNFGNSSLQSLSSLNLSKSGNLAEAATNLFDFLHKLDEYSLQNNISTIAIAPIPNEGIGLAINDRLTRAAG